MIITPQIMLNILLYYCTVFGAESVFTKIDMIIIDECHHVRKEHAYNKIMTCYRNISTSRPQVIVFTVSPTRSKGIEEGEENMKFLLQQMEAKCVVLDECNREMADCVPSPKEETVFCEQRPEDINCQVDLGRFIVGVVHRYLIRLVGKINGLFQIPKHALADLSSREMSPFFENWAGSVLDSLDQRTSLDPSKKSDLSSCIRLLRICNDSLGLLNDAGFESTIKMIAEGITKIAEQQDTRNREGMFPLVLCGLCSCCTIRSIPLVQQAFGMSNAGLAYSLFPCSLHWLASLKDTMTEIRCMVLYLQGLEMEYIS